MRPTTTNASPSNLPSVPSWIGDAVGGRSLTMPTFSRSRSRRTSTALQYGQMVCTAPDHRNSIVAPQLGQAAARAVTSGGSTGRLGRRPEASSRRERLAGVRALEVPHGHAFRADHLGEAFGEGPHRTRGAAEEVEAERAMLGEGVHREVRLGEEQHPRDAARWRKDVPLPRPDGTEPELVHHAVEESGERRAVGEALGIAAERL